MSVAETAAAGELPVAPYGEAARSPSGNLSGYAAVADHLVASGDELLVSVHRETDWVVLRGTLVLGGGEDAVERVHGMVLRVTDDDLDDTWEDIPVFISYLAGGETFRLRTVVRTSAELGLTVDAPSELVHSAPPTPGGGLRAVPQSEVEPGDRVYKVLETVEIIDRATNAVYSTLKGADLRGRTRRGAMTNHPGQLAVIISRLANEAGLLLSVGDDHSVYAVTLERTLMGQALPALAISFDSDRRPRVERGHVLHLTGMVSGRLCTMRLVAEEVEDGRIQCQEPDSVVRYQRRSNARFRILHQHLEMALVDEAGDVWPVKKVCDLSAGGIGVVPADAPPLRLHDPVSLRISLRARHEVTFAARVASSDTTFAPVRLGLQFVDLSANQLRMIDRMIQKLGRVVVDQ